MRHERGELDHARVASLIVVPAEADDQVLGVAEDALERVGRRVAKRGIDLVGRRLSGELGGEVHGRVVRHGHPQAMPSIRPVRAGTTSPMARGLGRGGDDGEPPPKRASSTLAIGARQFRGAGASRSPGGARGRSRRRRRRGTGQVGRLDRSRGQRPARVHPLSSAAQGGPAAAVADRYGTRLRTPRADDRRWARCLLSRPRLVEPPARGHPKPPRRHSAAWVVEGPMAVALSRRSRRRDGGVRGCRTAWRERHSPGDGQTESGRGDARPARVASAAAAELPARAGAAAPPGRVR
jgi:hypothetical protein